MCTLFVSFIHALTAQFMSNQRERGHILLQSVRHRSYYKLSGSNISRTVRPRITILYLDIHTDMLYSHTGYIAVSSRLQNAVKYCTKVRKMGPTGPRVE